MKKLVAAALAATLVLSASQGFAGEKSQKRQRSKDGSGSLLDGPQVADHQQQVAQAGDGDKGDRDPSFPGKPGHQANGCQQRQGHLHRGDHPAL